MYLMMLLMARFEVLHHEDRQPYVVRLVHVCVTSRIHMCDMTHTYITLYLIALLLAHLDVLHDEDKLLFHFGGQATAEKISLRFDVKYFRYISESCS